MEEEKITLLIADDEAAIRDGLRSMLSWKELGIELLEPVSDGMEALETLERQQPDIVLTDIRMPQLDGLDLIREARKRKIPSDFIIISGYGDFKYAQTAMKYGVTSYLLKPVASLELKNEVAGLRDRVLEIRREKRAAYQQHHQIRVGSNAVKEQFLLHLLKNHYANDQIIRETAANHGMEIEDAPSCVLLFAFHLPKRDGKCVFSEEDSQLFRFGMRNIIGELLGEKKHLFCDYEEDYLALLLNLDESEDLESFARDCVREMEAFGQIPIQVSIGSRIRKLGEAARSCIDAMEAMSYRLYRDDIRIFDSRKFNCQKGGQAAVQEIDTAGLTDALLRNAGEETEKYLNCFFESLFTEKNPSPSYLRGMCIYLVMDVQQRLRSYAGEETDLFEEDPYVEINQRTEWKEIQRWMHSLFERYAHILEQDGSFKKDPVIEKVKQYVKEHMAERIQAVEVAEYVNFSEVYLGVYFKKKTNMNFKKYVLVQKIEYAKEILKWPDSSIPEAAGAIGYEEVSSFHRTFKKMTGMTPAEYQQQYR